jgi:hypothetical protein
LGHLLLIFLGSYIVCFLTFLRFLNNNSWHSILWRLESVNLWGMLHFRLSYNGSFIWVWIFFYILESQDRLFSLWMQCLFLNCDSCCFTGNPDISTHFLKMVRTTFQYYLPHNEHLLIFQYKSFSLLHVVFPNMY